MDVPQKHLVLIRTRELASMLATPIFVADDEGRIVYYNEPAEQLLGRSFAEMGEISAEEWTSLFSPETPDGAPLPFAERPSGRAFVERRPTYGSLVVSSREGRRHRIFSAAYPLFAHKDEFVGVLTVFWPE